MFTVATKTEMKGRCHRYEVFRDREMLPFSDALQLWQTNDEFRAFFVGILAESPFKAYRWETPPLIRGTVGRPFEFVLVDSPGLDRPANDTAFHQYFSPAGHGVVSFESLGRDALMVVPSPRTDSSAYVHLAAFIRNGPTDQVDALWRLVGQYVEQRLDDRPVWLSTAGGGVAWLHVRLDSRPKYYSYSAYTR